MNHERFERLALSDQSLPPEEADQLRRHLGQCPTCARIHAGWAAVESSLQSAEMLGPASGFAARWRARQQVEAVGRGRRQAWRLFEWTTIGATGLTAALGVTLLQAPAYLPTAFASALQQALRLWLWTRAVGEVTSAFASNLPAPVAAAAVMGWFGLIAAVGLLAALGTFGILRFSFQGVRT